MYYDRKNITPEYKILSSFHHSSLYIGVYKNDERHHQVKGHIFLTIENAGTRPVSISRIDFELSIYDDPSDLEKLILSTDRLFNTQPIIIQPGHMANTKVEFFSKEFPPNHYPGPVDQIKQWSKSIVEKPLLLFLSHGEQILSDLKISKQ